MIMKFIKHLNDDEYEIQEALRSFSDDILITLQLDVLDTIKVYRNNSYR